MVWHDMMGVPMMIPRANRRMALALTLLPMPALADGKEMLAILDRNGDGSISRQEVVALRQTVFARMDADGDGRLTRAEVEAARAAAAERQARQAERDPFSLDADGDGQLTLAEFTGRTPGFDRADRDGDGVLSPAEIDRVRQLLGTLSGGQD
jgi:Ca2+-binding EF-hand superfamily protein